jgi:hypothetical protein
MTASRRDRQSRTEVCSLLANDRSTVTEVGRDYERLLVGTIPTTLGQASRGPAPDSPSSSRASLGSRSLGPFWAAALLADRLCSEALAGSVLTTAHRAIRASRRRELDRCCRPSLAIIPERSDAVGSGESAIGGRVGCSPMFAAVWLAVSAELVRPMVGGPAPAARWCRH